VPGEVKDIAPGVRALVAGNAGPFTFKGTMSYIIGQGQVAIVDPGPDDPAHVAALLDAVRNETVTHIFVTHTHRDHSPAVAAVKVATGAKVFAEGPHRLARPLHIGEAHPLDASADLDFCPDVTLALPRRRRATPRARSARPPRGGWIRSSRISRPLAARW